MYDDRGAWKMPMHDGKVRFSQREIREIAISILAITVIFALGFSNLLSNLDRSDLLYYVLYWLAMAAVVTILGFLIHEMAHKVVAQRYHAWAEFRMYPMGLVLGFVFSLLGFVLLAPGAVYIEGRITKEQYGKISLAGPLVNVIIGAIFLVAWILYPSGDLVSDSLQIMAYLSLFLAIFNLLPIPPLDGSKVVRWNIPVYILLILATGLMLLVAWGVIKI